MLDKKFKELRNKPESLWIEALLLNKKLLEKKIEDLELKQAELCNCPYTWVGIYPCRDGMRIPNYLCDKPYTHNFEYGNKKHSCFPTPITFSWYDHITESEIELMKKYKHSIFYFDGVQHRRADNQYEWIGEKYREWKMRVIK